MSEYIVNCHEIEGIETERDVRRGTTHESRIRPAEEGSICPMASVIFEGQKLTFDAEDSEKLRQLIDGHFRKLGGLR